jgi:hypothetical protein
MLGRKSYTTDELETAKTLVESQLAAYSDLTAAIEDEAPSESIDAAREDFEPLFFNTMALALDRLFVHRRSSATAKQAGPLNELELICDSLMNNDGILHTNGAGVYVPQQSVLKLEPGERIALSLEQFEQLAQAVLAEIEAKFVRPA